MNSRHTIWLVLLGVTANASADEPATQSYLQSVRALGSAKFSTREAASKHLSSGGATALCIVLDHADLTDLEVFTRVIQLIQITSARHDSATMHAAMDKLKHMATSDDPQDRSHAMQVLSTIHRRALETVLAAGGKLQTIKWPDGKTGVKVTLYQWRKSTLVALMSLSQLHLVLSGPRFEDTGLTELHRLKNMRVLDLRYTRAGDHTLHSVSQLTALEKLYLSRTPITDRGVSHLKTLQGLTELFLSDTSITDDCLSQLDKLPQLQRVSLRGTQITETAIEAFRARHPRCLIQY